MIFFVTSAQHLNNIITEEAQKAGCTDISAFSGGVEFTADNEAAYRFCLTTRVSTRMLLGLYQEEGVWSADDLYQASVVIPWENWVTPDTTFCITETAKHVDWLRNSHFATIRLKDAIVDRIREKFDNRRPVIDTENPDVTFHIHLDGDRVYWYVDFSGRALYKRGYRKEQTDAVLSEYLAAATLYRSNWGKAFLAGERPALLDPFCGSGMLTIEAALLLSDTAPGIVDRNREFPFMKLPGYDAELFEKVKGELIARSEEGKKLETKITGWDINPRAVDIARRNAEAAGVDHLIEFGIQDFTDITENEVPWPTGYIVTDPPYGVRLESSTPIEMLYQKTGDNFANMFPGWNISVLCGDSKLLSYIDMKPDRTNTLNNGGIPCQLAHYYVFSVEERNERIQKALEEKEKRLSTPLSEGAQMAYNRLKKNLKEITPLMEQQGVTNYRIYDADMPEYSAAIDLWAGKWITLSEYQAPEDIPEEDTRRRLEELVLATERATGIDLNEIYIKKRKRQTGKDQYTRFDDTSKYYIVRENGCNYLVNFRDYLDTGLFLDHRPIRQRIGEMAKHKRFLNLFCYTASATVTAAKGGALSTVSVDTSSTYLDWAEQNMRINNLEGMNHFFYREDCLKFLYSTFDTYDLIFCDPPTFSNSKGRKSFDVQRDHVDLIKGCMNHLSDDGTLIFSCNYRKFRLAPFIPDDFDVREITPETIGDDFKRDPKCHYCFLIRKKQPKPRLVLKKK